MNDCFHNIEPEHKFAFLIKKEDLILHRVCTVHCTASTTLAAVQLSQLSLPPHGPGVSAAASSAVSR